MKQLTQTGLLALSTLAFVSGSASAATAADVNAWFAPLLGDHVLQGDQGCATTNVFIPEHGGGHPAITLQGEADYLVAFIGEGSGVQLSATRFYQERKLGGVDVPFNRSELEVRKDENGALASFHWQYSEWSGGLVFGKWVLKQDLTCTAAN